MFLIWISGEDAPIATAANEEQAGFITRALNAYDLLIGGEYQAEYSAASTPDKRVLAMDDDALRLVRGSEA